ncbi:hypothetical protein RMCBS344292_17795 [Rhizopus microsporus]|nr:hypothetical protein RMCBS344292_17795 [Rhizopus microsporus]
MLNYFINKRQNGNNENTLNATHDYNKLSFFKLFKKKRNISLEEGNSVEPKTTSSTTEVTRGKGREIRRESDLHFYEGGVRTKHKTAIKWVGRVGFIAKGVVYGCIGVLTLTNLSGAWTPNGSEGNESPQGAFLLLGGIPAVGRTILIVMAVGLCLYIIWRFWEAITGQGSDASFSKKKNFFRYRLSPFVSGCVYTAYTYYVVHMIFQTEEEQQTSASSKTFPASWAESGIGKAGIVLLGIAFLIAFFTQMVNAVKGTFIKDLKTSEPNARKWEAFIVHWMGRIGFFGRAALFGTLSGFFWDSLAQRNESGEKNMVAAAVSKLANSGGGRFFMGLLGVTLVIYACFAISNAYYKYFPTPPPTRQEFYTNEFVHPELSDDDLEQQRRRMDRSNDTHISPFSIRRLFYFFKKKNNTEGGEK